MECVEVVRQEVYYGDVVSFNTGTCLRGTPLKISERRREAVRRFYRALLAYFGVCNCSSAVRAAAWVGLNARTLESSAAASVLLPWAVRAVARL